MRTNRRVLIVHHLEPMWQEGYKKFGTSFFKLSEKVATHIRRSKYDLVILCRFEDNDMDENYYDFGLHELVNTVHTYAYGWEKCMFEDSNHRWVEGGNHSEVVLIEPWMEELVHDHVSLCGAFDGECIEDMEIALAGVGIKPRRIESLIV